VVFIILNYSNYKKIIFSLLSLILTFSLVLPSIGLAKNSTEPTVNIDSKLIEKANPFIYLDSKTKEFKVTKNIYSALNEKEIATVKEVIQKSNKEVKLYQDDLVINVKENKFNAKEETSDDVQARSINKKKHFDWDFTWWGLKIYWSDKFVKTLKNNLVIYGGSVAALNATIAYYISPPGWVTSVVTAIAGIGVGTFIKQNKGCGIYLDCYLYVPTRWYSAC